MMSSMCGGEQHRQSAGIGRNRQALKHLPTLSRPYGTGRADEGVLQAVNTQAVNGLLTLRRRYAARICVP